jgi:hypothetical protein
VAEDVGEPQPHEADVALAHEREDILGCLGPVGRHQRESSGRPREYVPSPVIAGAGWRRTAIRECASGT